MPDVIPTGQFTSKALTSKAQALNAKREDVSAAAAWCVENDKGEAAAVSSGLFPQASRGKIRAEIKRLRKPGGRVRDHHNQLMTNTERLQVANWIRVFGLLRIIGTFVHYILLLVTVALL